MIDMMYIRGFYPPHIADNAVFQKHILKEYVELLALEWITRSEYAKKMVFIGGTCLRLVYGIDRFSEDLDFDCKELGADDFHQMTEKLIAFLRLQGLRVELRAKDSSRLTAYRSNVYFPELLFDLQLTGHREERFLMKIEAQNQGVDYKREQAIVRRNSFLFPVAVPPIGVLLSMKISALLARQKGRDFYDVMFLWSRTKPDYSFLRQRVDIDDETILKTRIQDMLRTVNINEKRRDFEHLLFDSRRSEQILYFDKLILES